ncbi:valyl-tRNA synthetase [Rhizophagus clarus]|uniref:valine--tRNA ligase n=1 Tax=Rhizophagus clarus TaxID=94130 RepID=A0A8H3LBF9_9GLOM|nr:valyl-tRNA synthetase [Rhizophagus clarus]
MEVSLNCVFLGKPLSDSFIVDLNKINTINGYTIIWNKKKKALSSIEDSDLMILWKVDIALRDKLKDFNEEQIGNEGVKLVPIESDVDAAIMVNIFQVLNTLMGPYLLFGIRKRKHKLKDFNEEQIGNEGVKLVPIESDVDAAIMVNIFQSNASLFIQAASEKIASLLTSQEQSIITLVKGAKSVHVFQKGEAIPTGCALSTVNDEINVLLMVKGFIDIDAEVSKFEKKLDKTIQSLTSLQKNISIPGYENKVPEDVREANDIKLKNYQAEIDALTHSIQNFLKLKDS